MGAPTAPPERPDDAQFAPGGGLLVRPRPGGPRTALKAAFAAGPAAGGPPPVIPLAGGLGETVEFETDLFVGRMKVVFRMPHEQQAAEVAEMLAGKKRQMWVMIQGRVKRAVPLEELQYGSFYTRPLRFPAPLILGPALHWLSARLGSTLQMQLRGDSPHVTGPLCAAVQMLNVSRPGAEPDLVAAQEDTRLLLGPELKGEPMPSNKRRSYFKRAGHRAGREFTPDHVITLHCYDHSFNYHTFRMSVPPCFQLDMVKVLDGQPMDISLRDRRSGEWAFRFEVWHRRALAHLRRQEERSRDQGARRRAGRSGGGGGEWSDDSGDEGNAAAAAAAVDPAEALRRREAQAVIAAHRISFEISEDGDDGSDDDGGGGGGGGGGGAALALAARRSDAGSSGGDGSDKDSSGGSGGGGAGGSSSSVVSTATASSGAAAASDAAPGSYPSV
ncbi:MAG: hypothetical protein J3K34DRAFT_518288 [Monoraphidium minutum]|nr:MAG: hypothetical protein J3K34DRAFT_518288 [Monoraphidium minutum]